MKNKLGVIIKFGFGFVWMVIMFLGCSDDPGKIGLDLLPTGDLVKASRVIVKESIEAYTEIDGNQRTDESAYNLFGTFNDPVFGKTTADFACQFRLNSFPVLDKGAQPDSLVLYLYYQEVYGDTITPQHIKVYELGSDLSLSDKYYQDEDLKGLTKPTVLADISYIPKFKLDSLTNYYGSTKANPRDTVTQIIAIKLDVSLVNYLWSADSLTLSNNDSFLNYFKGLYVEAEDLSQGGSIMKINTVAQSNTIGHGSFLVMHYHNSEEDSLNYSLGIVKESSARVGRFAHDYTSTAFAENLGSTDAQDTLIYLQTTGGLRTKILIPNLGTWKDSTNFAINQAELVFQVDSTVSDPSKFLSPDQLVLSAIAFDKDGKEVEYLPSDVAFSSAYYGGRYNIVDKTYRFNIANHLQEVIENKKENNGFYLSTAFRSAIFRRTVLKGATSKTGIKLQITYSKLN